MSSTLSISYAFYRVPTTVITGNAKVPCRRDAMADTYLVYGITYEINENLTTACLLPNVLKRIKFIQ